jgi:hypothetical protein
MYNQIPVMPEPHQPRRVRLEVCEMTEQVESMM